MPKIPSLVTRALLICGAGFAVQAMAKDGISHHGAAPDSGGVTLTLPSCANKGDIVQIGVSYPATNPTNVTVTLTQPTSGAPYLLEQKISKRQYDGSSGGTTHLLNIDTFTQIGGTARVKAVVAGVGNASGRFQIPCP